MLLGLADLSGIDLAGKSQDEISVTARDLASQASQNGTDGLAIRLSSTKQAKNLDELLSAIQLTSSPIIFIAPHDSDSWHSLDLTTVSGIIIENATILPSGERRDYFRSRTLRQIMARCNAERSQRQDFFVGFHDMWEVRPHPAVIRRAVKLADHFGAVIEHGLVLTEDDDVSLGASRRPAASTLSGFEYLRRGDCTELQKVWSNDLRKTYVTNGDPAPEHETLPLETIGVVVPGIKNHFRHHRLSPELRQIRDEIPSRIEAPKYIDQAPPRSEFWDQSSDGEPLSPFGCYSVITEPTSEEYDAVVKAQSHLKDLNLLHVVKGVELHRHVESYRQLCDSGRGSELVQSLATGLSTGRTRVYKGLDTGFGVPDRDVSFWGVVRQRLDGESGSVDIFVSQKAPDDATTILHSWLAHHGISRVERYKIECLLEPDSTRSEELILPKNIRAAIEDASPSEILSLLQQIHVSGIDDGFRNPMIHLCKKILLDGTSHAAWRKLHARSVLDRSVDMRQLLQVRLEHFARQGAIRLPDIDALLSVFASLETTIEDALFGGDRETLNTLFQPLLSTYDPWREHTTTDYVDVNADLYALMILSILKRAAFEEVYIEATDRCPFFLPQSDQAAVFSELWVLGSQCEIYFSLLPRDLGQIVFERYQEFLRLSPPGEDERVGNEIMTMYSGADVASPNADDKKTSRVPLTSHQRIQSWKRGMTELGAMSIFCLPAIIDVVLLTFVGRGLFMTAFMAPRHLEAASYALLIALLLTAGVTGWVGSTGNYYLANYAYDNMIYFHVQRLSGGFVLTLLVAAGGLVGFAVTYDVAVGFIFVGYVLVITTYLNLLGVMATMHQPNSPITSGRTVIWRTMPILFISPILSAFVNGHDVIIYLPVTSGFLFVLLWQYRRLCHEWSGWLDRIPTFSDKDILAWFSSKSDAETTDEDKAEAQNKEAQDAFRRAVNAYSARTRDPSSPAVKTSEDALVIKVADGMPYVSWLFEKSSPDGSSPEPFSTSWFTQLGEAVKQQRQLSRGLKEHNVLLLFRMAKYDLAQNLGLFLVALMDRWVTIVMAQRKPTSTIYINSRARYGICLSILYFCFSVMLLDTTLQKYWSVRFKLSEEKLRDYEHKKMVARQWEGRRMQKFGQAITELFGKIAVAFGVVCLFLWILVDAPASTILFYCYILGYTGVIVMQFNRCFTTNVHAHVTIIMVSAVIGFLTGITLHAVPRTAGWLYADVVAQNVASVLAAIGTSLWSWKDWSSPTRRAKPSTEEADQGDVVVQRQLGAEARMTDRIQSKRVQDVGGTLINLDDGSVVPEKIFHLLSESASQQKFKGATPWAKDVLDASIRLWSSRKLRIRVVGRDVLADAGLSDISSYSQLIGGNIEITTGVLGTTELGLPSWQNLLATVIAEAILYHVARHELKYSHCQAVRAEHCLSLHRTISKRLDFQLALESIGMLNQLQRKTNCEVMRHLCLDLSVDSQWDTLPSSVRAAIIQRIIGDDVSLAQDVRDWVSSVGVDLDTIDFHLGLALQIFQRSRDRDLSRIQFPGREKDGMAADGPAELFPVRMADSGKPTHQLRRAFRAATSLPFTSIKWIAIISSAGADIERELWYCLRNNYFRPFILGVLLLAWQACRGLKNAWIFVLLIYHRPKLLRTSRLARKGARRKMKNNYVVVELPRKVVTAFATEDDDQMMVLDMYDGALKSPPKGKKPSSKAIYDGTRLKARVDDGTVATTYQYPPNKRTRWPLSKEANGNGFRTIAFYDKHGRVTHGLLTIGTTEYAFKYHFKATPKASPEILAADFKLAAPGSQDMLSVSWGTPLRHDAEDYNWVPSNRICRIAKLIDGKKYITEVEYNHRRDPLVTTFIQEASGRRTAVAKAPLVFDDEAMLLARPRNLSFDMDDLLIYHSSLQVKQMKRHAKHASRSWLSYLHPLTWLTWRGKRVYQPVATWRIRTELWNDWVHSGTLDAVSACWMDELILREEPRLKKYWRARDGGRLDKATKFLDDDLDQIVSAIEIATDVSEVCLLPIRTADLYSMGSGKDANEVTNRPEDCFDDTENRISVIFNDIGCWPEAPGGVSNCRRDLVNGHTTIRNHVLAECANDFCIPRFQVERNVQSIKLLPLWGLDGKSADHGLIDNLLQSQVDEKVRNTDVQRDISDIFIPLLRDFVKGARTKRHSRADLIKYSNVMLSMSKYYEHKDYSRTWSSREVEDAWVDAWLLPYESDPNIMDPAKCFAIERPSIADFREALGIYLAYFFIFSVKIPERCPRVFQSTHHGISSLFGMVLKHRRGATFGIWDHAILWRECCLNISPAQCELPISVQSMLLSGIGLATRLAYFHADVILPCTSLFNPMWEAEIGTDQGLLGSRSAFKRRIDPIVNGISNMESFTPVDKIRTEKPTVVMLSNVQFIKGVKTAILAADIIINRFGFKDYQLVVYGAKDRQPSYALEMAKLIVDNNLSDKVILAGFGKPKEVLKDAWLFMNSSISEGLPLAIGEAALAGVPIVATEVGATALVLTDPKDQDQRYGEVVPPNDPLALARAQISMLSMTGPWAKFTTTQETDARTGMPDEITPLDVDWLTERMYAKSEDRRKLGLLSREVVLHSFHGERYLREHEQMYWVQWHQAMMRDDEALRRVMGRTFKFGALPVLRYRDYEEEQSGSPSGPRSESSASWSSESSESLGAGSDEKRVMVRWQDFGGRRSVKRQRRRLSKQVRMGLV